MKVIDKSVIDAIHSCMREENLTQRAFATKAGIHFTTINRWLSGGVHSIQVGLWEEILPIIMPYLKGDSLDDDPMVENTSELRLLISQHMLEQNLSVEVLTSRIGYDKPDDILDLLTGRVPKWFPDILSHIACELGISLDHLPLIRGERVLLRPEAGNVAFHSRLVPVTLINYCENLLRRSDIEPGLQG